MGGRGSSSGGGGGGSALSAKMPSLSGSPKQISWAESIRHDALANVDLLVERARDTSASTLNGIALPGNGGYVRPAAAQKVKEYIVNGFQNITSASRIIDYRRDFSFDNIKRSMITAQIEINKKKK